ncbi:Ubiquitin carboxyl-terminal hydrolase 27 [Linum grandiflorum]
MVGCTLEDCLKRFIAAEQLENYHCSHCWHLVAIKYLRLRGASESDVGQITRCNERDSCTCRSLFHLDNLPWSNNYSRTFKRLSIARCPKILCIHLQRASINHFGEPIKLQGHIRFPLVLDLLPFTLKELQSEKRSPHSNKPVVRACISSKYPASEEVLASDGVEASEQLQTVIGESNLVAGVETIGMDTSSLAEDKADQPVDEAVYRLVSVVEHFGRSGGGHYTVYRSAGYEDCSSGEEEEKKKHSHLHWFCVSDSQVSRVSEEDVLAAEASLLFYERIAQC